jgi:hypothetical protein
MLDSLAVLYLSHTLLRLAVHSLKITRGVSHWGLANYIKKYLKAKEKLWKLKYFTMQNNILLKGTKILQDIIAL